MVFAYISCQQTPKSYVVFLSVVWVALKRTGFSASEVALKRAGCVARSQRCSKWRPFAFTHALSRVCHWSMASSIMPWGIRSQMSLKLCFSSSVSRFSFWVMSGGVETQLTWGGKLCTRLRSSGYQMVKLIAIDLHMYKIFKITQVSFLRHSVFTAHGRAGILLGCEKIARKYLQPSFPRGYQKSRFSINISLYLGNDTRYGHSYNGKRIGTLMWSVERWH